MSRDEVVKDGKLSDVESDVDLSKVEIDEVAISDVSNEVDGVEEVIETEDNIADVETVVSEDKNKKGGMQPVYPILLAISLSVCAYSGYKYATNLKDKSVTDKKSEIVVDLAKPEVVEDKTPYLDVDLAPLKEKNADTVGWLKVGAVGIDVPIVQTTDNKFYLDNDIDKKKNSGGWVFADCKANLDHMSTNTVIYGHNLRGRQFGLLKKFLDPEVSNQEGANLIQFTTEDKQMLFEVVSVYVTHYNDWEYVKQSFASDIEKMDFVNMIKDKNTVEAFQQETLSGSDNYLTFSTCHGAVGTDKRLVVHSRLIASRPVADKEEVKQK